MMFIKAKQFGDTVVLECVGNLRAGDETAALRRSALCSAARTTLVIDLSGVEKVDGAGLGLLAFLQGWSRSAGISLKIADPSPRVYRLLELTRLASVLEICTRQEVDEKLEHAPTPAMQCAEIVQVLMAAHN